jgi:phenylacetic acid degradation operon negative regulatory protein
VSSGPPSNGRGTTPQAVVMTMLGRYCLLTNPAMSTTGYIAVLARIGVTPQATRLTVSRMTERGYLKRLRSGREAYFRASEVGLNIVRVQEQHTFEDPMKDSGNGAWTILSFSVPENRRGDRQLLRRRLSWEGFGLLRDGMWIAPGELDLERVLDPELFEGVQDLVDGFTAYPKFGDVHRMISRTWKLDQLRERYEQFLYDWDVPDPAPVAMDSLGRYLMLVTAWRQLIREAPRLPAEHLPADWPAPRCHALFRRLHEEYRVHARKLFDEILADNRLPGDN